MEETCGGVYIELSYLTLRSTISNCYSCRKEESGDKWPIFDEFMEAKLKEWITLALRRPNKIFEESRPVCRANLVIDGCQLCDMVPAATVRFKYVWKSHAVSYWKWCFNWRDLNLQHWPKYLYHYIMELLASYSSAGLGFWLREDRHLLSSTIGPPPNFCCRHALPSSQTFIHQCKIFDWLSSRCGWAGNR